MAMAADAAGAAAWRAHRQQLLGLTAFDRHKRLVADYVNFYGGRRPEPPPVVATRTDHDILREQYRFVRSEEDDAGGDAWEVRLARRYYGKLFREYAIVDLSRYKEGKVGMRWRSEKEVISGKGQFSCGARGCDESRGLATYEVPFGYEEAGQKKQALVKVRLCPEHALQLNHRKNQEAIRAQRKALRRQQRSGGGVEASDTGTGAGAGSASAPVTSRKRQLSGADEEEEEDVEHHKGQQSTPSGRCTGQETGGDSGKRAGGPGEGTAEDVNVWKGRQPALEASRDDEFDEFFTGMFP